MGINRPGPIVLGIAATLLGVGLARFAYTALLPELILQAWFTANEAGWLGAANLIGYTLGALLSAAIAARFDTARVARVCAVLVVASFVVCAWPFPMALYFLARFISGLCGAMLMVLVPSTMLQSLPLAARAWGGATIFLGVGLGILLSATLVPWLVSAGVGIAWLGLALLGGLSLMLLFAPWPVETIKPVSGREAPSSGALTLPLLLVCGIYALDAIGFVPHTLFWVDYLQRHLDLSAGQSALQWALFGVGALLGPFVVGQLGRHSGWDRLLLAALLVKATAVALPAWHPALWSLSLSSLLVGALVPGMVAIVSARLADLTSPSGHVRAWGLATATFACAQGAAAALFVGLYSGASGGGADRVFLWAAMALLLGGLLAGLMMTTRLGDTKRDKPLQKSERSP
ncbi:MAG: YbfB/YjiJ family MFS transporter [Oleiphilaceae bacterium]|nr:YbfB/YjiJ family MFS transporter [Oleiphilaceae bacterium]